MRTSGFVVIEGLDGAGTTTQAERVAGSLLASDLRVCLTAEPSEGPAGTLLRAHLRGEVTLPPRAAALTFCADRIEHLEHVIGPALAAGDWVVCDRYLLSTLAYQGAEGVPASFVMACSEGVLVPDLTVVLEVAPAVQSQRLARRASVERYEAAERQAAIRGAYASSVEVLRSAGHRIEVISGEGHPDALTEQILGLLEALPDS